METIFDKKIIFKGRSQLRVRMPFFLTRKTYSIFKIVGYAENIVFACSHYISHLEKVKISFFFMNYL